MKVERGFCEWSCAVGDRAREREKWERSNGNYGDLHDGKQMSDKDKDDGWWAKTLNGVDRVIDVSDQLVHFVKWLASAF